MQVAAAHLAHDAVAEELTGHVGDGTVGARLHLGSDVEVAREPKVCHLGREPMRLRRRARQQHVTCARELAPFNRLPHMHPCH